MTTIKLQTPIIWGTETINELTFRRPKSKDLRKMPIGTAVTGDLIDLAARLSGQSISLLDELEAQDCFQVIEVMANFLAPGQPTSEMQSAG